MKKFGLYFITLLAINTVTLAQQRRDYQYEPGTPATEARAQWHELTKGKELARGKKVLFSPQPNYRLTTDDNDPYDLTDGKLSSRQDDRIWFNEDAVGWATSTATIRGVFLTIDLGEIQPVGQIAIRVLGGGEQGSLNLPKEVEFLASIDGKRYHSLQLKSKLSEVRKNENNNRTNFYIPEEGKAFMAPMVCKEPVKARYITLRIMPDYVLFTDQISILKATEKQEARAIDSYPKSETQIFSDGLAVMPIHEPLVVTTNVVTPNFFVINDMTGEDLTKNPATIRIELPDGLKILPNSLRQFEEKESDIPDFHRYEFSYDGIHRYTSPSGQIGPVWIVEDEKTRMPSKEEVVITGIINNKESHRLKYPVKRIRIPEAPEIKGLDFSIAWMDDRLSADWPNFLDNYKKLGFNYVPTFPRNYGKDKDGNWNEKAQKYLSRLQQARSKGMNILYNESPFHVMWSNVQKDLKADKISEAEAKELFTQINGKRGKWMNILYRGKYYQNEIKRIADLAKLVQPDHVYLDIEWWYQSVQESKKDPRVISTWEDSGKDWEDFVTDLGSDIMNDLISSIRQAVPERNLTIGSYGVSPLKPIYNGILAWKKLYPDTLDIAQPSMYKLSSDTQAAAENIRNIYEDTQEKNIIPWLTTGTYIEYSPKKVEPLVLETILNGGKGIGYYWFGDFDPMDFYYHAKAIQELKPYETLLNKGKPLTYSGGTNNQLHYTAFGTDEEVLVLVGNYSGSHVTKVLLSRPIPSVTKVLLDGKEHTIDKQGTITINVLPDEVKLLYFHR